MPPSHQEFHLREQPDWLEVIHSKCNDRSPFDEGHYPTIHRHRWALQSRLDRHLDEGWALFQHTTNHLFQ